MATFGPQNWWPGDTPFEIMIGAVLTQNTAWTNVERAICNLKEEQMLSLEAINGVDTGLLAALIRSSGYYNQKAARLKGLISYISDTHGDLDNFFNQDGATLRAELLSIKGIGPETADSITLYAAEKPTFVVDAYTHRIFSRHNMVAEETDYYQIQDFFISNLPEDLQLYNEYHALIVRLGKNYCKKTKPLCDTCPIKDL